MVNNKKSFVLYNDYSESFLDLSDEEAGILIKHIFNFVNGVPSELDSRLIKMAFTPIRQQLDRDLSKWEERINERSDSGTIGNLKRWHPDLYEQFEQGELNLKEAVKISKGRKRSLSDNSDRKESQTVANVAVNVNDNVTVNVINNNIEDRKLKFASTLEAFKEKYPSGLLNDFFKYWTEPNKSNTKFRKELEKTWSLERRLETWAKNDRSFNKENAFSKNESPSLSSRIPTV